MDSDEYDDDIADEDLAEVLSQAGTSFSSRIGSGNPVNTEHTHPTSLNRTNSTTRPGTITLSRKIPGIALATGRNEPRGRSLAAELDELPSDAFSSSPESRSTAAVQPVGRPTPRQGLVRTSSSSFRQTTLWGGTVDADGPRESQPGAGRVYRGDQPPEVPSHHALNKEALGTWVYPTNLGVTRDYQFSIVKNGLFNNTLVALPTGLGKTFIAATVMLNYYRWTKDAKIVFVAPTKPLVAQQVDACFNIAGISRSTTTLLTGDTSPALRVDEWESKRVFFMTPQTLLNDLSAGYADPKSIVLLVIDEAHRSVGEYAYAKVVKLMRRFNNSFRVLALTATPGSKVETVQEVIDNLGISHVEIRTEESIDIRQYVHQRNIDRFVLDPSDEILAIKELFTKALKPLVDKLSQQNIYYNRDPMEFSSFGLLKAQKEWFAGAGRHANQGVQFMMRAIFSILTSLAHSVKLLTFHGIKPFYENMKDFRSETEGKGQKGSKYKKQLIEDQNFQEMMSMIEKWFRIDGFIGHPKITALADTILNHFMDAGEGSATRVIVFSEYRDSAEDIVRGLNAHKPLIKATVFVGQADSKRSEGMKQAQQIDTIEKFKNGSYNVLVATSIGEEGLDIGQVDLIICYDASASPIRMLQRMGRTGRKRAGKIVLLLMRGKEEENFARSKDNYEQMQKLICEGSKFNFRHDLSTRILPRDSRPEVDMRHVDIPIENTQSNDLPEPRKRRAPTKKKPPKKFHMPDGVETGFMRASAIGQALTNPPGPKRGRPKESMPEETNVLVDIPSLESVLLSASDLRELDRTYRQLPYGTETVEETELPSLTAFPGLQRILRPVGKLRHGRQTKKFVKLFQILAKSQTSGNKWIYPYGEEDDSRYEDISVKPFASDSDTSAPSEARGHKRPHAITVSDGAYGSERESQPKRRKSNLGAKAKAKTKTKTKAKTFSVVSEAEEDPSDGTEEESDIPRRGRPKKGTTARRKPKARRKTGRGINSDEVGDDCERDSDLLESDGSDSGGDLIGFIDDRLTSSIRREEAPSTSQTTTTASPLPTRFKGNSVYEPMELPPTQDTDDDGLPPLSQILPPKRAAATSGDSDEDSDLPRMQTGRQARRRAIFDDSDSD